jgi:hypothetical protein
VSFSGSGEPFGQQSTALGAMQAERDARRLFGEAVFVPLERLRRWTCYLFSLLRIHSPNCEHCNICDTRWVEVKKRLEELQ